MDELTTEQVNTLVATERVTTCFSLVGILLILTSYYLTPYFKKPINRLVVYASFGNLGTCVASLISEAGPSAGAAAPICQLQGFFVQMFLGVDCYWALFMAVNVYLAFFRGYSTKQLQRLDVFYLMTCYGLAFVPAFVYIFIKTDSRGSVYGPAIIWCWVTVSWDPLRIATLYGIVWIAIASAIIIYSMAGRVIWAKRKHLKGFLNPLNEHPFESSVVTEVTVSTEVRRTKSASDEEAGLPQGMPTEEAASSEPSPDFQAYSVDVITMDKRKEMPDLMRVRSITRDVANSAPNADAWLYARVAFLFFLALMITWIPSSVNRVYALIHPTTVNFGLNFASSLVFPLQGFWNLIVYCITSRSACKNLWNDLRGRAPPFRKHSMVSEATKNDVRLDRFAHRTSQRLHSDADSVASLTRD